MKSQNEAFPFLQQGHALYVETGNPWGIGQTLFSLGIVDEFNGEFQKAWATYQQVLSSFGPSDSPISIASVKSQLSQVATRLGNYTEALHLANEGLDIFREVGIVWGISASYFRLARAYLASGDLCEARRYTIEALKVGIDNGMTGHTEFALGCAARLRMAQGQYDQAVQMMSLLTAYLGIRDSDSYRRLLDDIKEIMPPDAFARAFVQGKQTTLDGMAKAVLTELRRESEEDLTSEIML